jgi:hypothetical protein
MTPDAPTGRRHIYTYIWYSFMKLGGPPLTRATLATLATVFERFSDRGYFWLK